jgi:hypothetical protein
MAWNKRISTLEGANAFWGNYGIHIAEEGRSEYKALLGSGQSITAPSLTALWKALGDKFVKR